MPAFGVWPARITSLTVGGGGAGGQPIYAGTMFLVDDCEPYARAPLASAGGYDDEYAVNRLDSIIIPTSLLTIVLISFFLIVVIIVC